MAFVSGKVANRAGDRLERNVADILEDKGYEFVQRNRFFPARTLEQPVYTRQCELGKDIYGRRRRVDFILYHPVRFQNCLVIQCKWQASAGSVEEKYPFEVLSIAQGQYDTIVIIDGGGYTPEAKQWLLDQSGKNHLLDVQSQGDFARYARRHL